MKLGSNQSEGMKTKEFRCPVHGYISLPASYCEHFVDTGIFQRLKKIRQTTMYVLFPSAHHDRFSHSLGVYHLGKIAFGNLTRNAAVFNRLNQRRLDGYKHSFLIACLLHDCAHTPFSHTCEEYLDIERNLDAELIKEVSSTRFNDDYQYSEPGTHEKASAIIVSTQFKDSIEKRGADLELVVRMITGCKYRKPNSKQQLENCLIELLHSRTIDVDKLDYIMRDTWTSGVNNISIDIDRLLSAITIQKDKKNNLRLAYKKSAMSVLQNVVDARNYLYRWIYSHHKVIYFQELLTKAIDTLAKLVSPDNSKDFYKKFFSLESLLKPLNIGANVTIYLPTEGDLNYLFKQYFESIPEATEMFCCKKRRPLWKSFAEYEWIFSSVPPSDQKMFEKLVSDKLPEYWAQLGGNPNDLVISHVEPKLIDLKKGDLHVVFGDRCVSYTEIFKEKEEQSVKFFYVYGPEKFIKRREEIREFISKLL